MADADLSRKALARLVREGGAKAGVTLSTDHTAVSRWLNGVTPRERTAGFVVDALSSRLGRSLTVADIGMSSAARLPSGLGLVYSSDVAQTISDLGVLWDADLRSDTEVVDSVLNIPAWSASSLAWLIGAREPERDPPAAGRRIGLPDVAALRGTSDAFASLDNRFGGGHARAALVQYLKHDVEQMLRASHGDAVGKALFVASAEATLLVAWMSYDSCLHGLAQRYFIQALRLAEAGGDRLLAASIMSAMSHQATFVGKFREAADLARAAVAGIATAGTHTLRAQFLTMEARALARLGDQRACDLAMSDAVAHFERRNVSEDPVFIAYFDESELAAELGHCHRDLGRAVAASSYAGQSLSPDGSYVRSDFFATMVLADAYAAAGEAEQACAVATQALELGRVLKSGRCESYVTEFRGRLAKVGGSRALSSLNEQFADHPLWQRIA